MISNYEHILISAFRYALGRRTYIVKITCEYLINEIPKLSSDTIFLLLKELEENISGDSCDIMEWNKLRKALKLEQRDRKI